MDPASELEWQERWRSAQLARAVRDPAREKFFAIVAYPGSSGLLHLGHLRGLVLADSLVRYERMRGKQVFFPTGTHASGLPSVTFAQRVRDRDPVLLAQLESAQIRGDALARIEEPEAAARFLGQLYLGIYRRMGFLLDESAYVTTIDPDYQAFIQWQFARLADRGALRQGPYLASVCPICGPVSVDPSETDLSSGGDAEVVRYTTIPFSLEDGRELLAATLRPETVYGVTNLWVPESVPLVVWHHGERNFLVSAAGGARLVEQHGGHLGKEEPISGLVGRTVRVPFTHLEVPVLASAVVEPDRGTGVVMSVPAHAPADWLAVQALAPEARAKIPSIREIIYVAEEAGLTESERKLRAGTGSPAERAARATGARSLADREALEEATERLYRLELSRGKMLPAVFAPIAVAEARERLERSFDAAGTGLALEEFSKPVICRNGHAVVLRKLTGQWFLRYSDAEWKNATKAALASIVVSPDAYARELPGVIDWFEDRPCARRGRWLGTPLPSDPSWIIEPIADSTFYPAYFVVRRFVADGRLSLAQLTPALFDYVFLGVGAGEPSVAPELLRELRAEFEYWYPLDLNVGGKEHKRVHFPAFLFTHAKLLPPERQPRGLLVHWWLVGASGTKISKKETGVKGGTMPPIADAADRWGADALRLYHIVSASADQDFAWDPGRLDEARDRLIDVERLLRAAVAGGGGGPAELEAWLEDAVHTLLHEIEEAWEQRDLRQVAQRVYYALPALLRRYTARGGEPGPALERIGRTALRLLSPITPHLAEELARAEGVPLVATQSYPRPTELAENPTARVREAYLLAVEEDLQSALRPLLAKGSPPTALTFYVAAPWKRTVDEWVRQSTASPSERTREILARAEREPSLAAGREEIGPYLAKNAERVRSEPSTEWHPVDELALLRASEGYLARRFSLNQVNVHPETAASDVDPLGRRQRARPHHPAFYFHSGGPAPGPRR
ncbi:MAG TPA: class I tRNA ligase family protein [Thermoplasmata archaeon]|nr:class I tRNA ligase family protein [Thermoplasmata archaeon]